VKIVRRPNQIFYPFYNLLEHQLKWVCILQGVLGNTTFLFCYKLKTIETFSLQQTCDSKRKTSNRILKTMLALRRWGNWCIKLKHKLSTYELWLWKSGRTFHQMEFKICYLQLAVCCKGYATFSIAYLYYMIKALLISTISVLVWPSAASPS
jgi:hypothetical protein